MMKIILAGGSGQVGTILARAFHGRGDEVVILSRKRPGAGHASNADPASGPGAAPRGPRHVQWDARTLGDWTCELEGAGALINLAGRSVNCRYNAKNRRQIMDSRIESTRMVGEAIRRAENPPPVWLQSSTATIYAHRTDAPNDEATGIIGGGEPGAPEKWNFSIDVARAWERTCQEIQTPRTRKVLMRIAMVMSPDRGGVFDTLLGLVRHGLGGTIGDGRQYVSWVHDQDFVAAVNWLIRDIRLSGPVNIAAPEPVPNADFMRVLRRAWGARIGLPATKWMLEIGTFLMRSESELVLKSRRVTPGRLLASGFEFQFPAWPAAAANLCRRWREMQS